jgi:hypothetical protein
MKLLGNLFVIALSLTAVLLTADCDWYCDGSGCYVGDGGDPQPSPGPYFVAWSVNSDWDNQNEDGPPDGSCFITQNTNFGTFTRTYNTGQQVIGPVYYYVPKVYQDAYVKVDTADITDATMKTIDSGAITVWANTLSADKQSGHFYSLLPQESTDPTAPIEVASSQSDPGYPGITDGQLDPNMDYFASAVIYYYMPEITGQPYNLYYQVALHELGHAQGLAHNPWPGSAMYPSAEDGTQEDCFTYNASNPAKSTNPPPQDTSALEAQYDPVLSIPSPKPCKKEPCPQDRPRPPSGPHLSWAQIYRLKKSWPWIHLTDPLGARTASIDSVWLASSLAVAGTVENVVSSVSDGINRIAIRRVSVERVIRNSFGPDTRVEAGQDIYVADSERADGGEYLDDPALKPGSRMVLFLRRQSDPVLASLPTIVYRPTTLFASKWNVDARGRMFAAGMGGSRASSQLNGMQWTALTKYLASTHRLAPSAGDGTITQVLLQERGVRDSRERLAYARALMQQPIEVLKWAMRSDTRW